MGSLALSGVRTCNIALSRYVICVCYKFENLILLWLFFAVVLFIMGVHKRVIAPSIITARTRIVLGDFNMSCDDTGKLILKPRPTTT